MDKVQAVELASKIQNDASFRDEFRLDPVGIATREGVQLDTQERQMAESLRGLNDADLAERLTSFLI